MCCRMQRDRKNQDVGQMRRVKNVLLQNRIFLLQMETDYSNPYFFILRHSEARSMPRISEARVRTPPVS